MMMHRGRNNSSIISRISIDKMLSIWKLIYQDTVYMLCEYWDRVYNKLLDMALSVRIKKDGI